MVERQVLTIPVEGGEVYFSTVEFLHENDSGHPDNQLRIMIEKAKSFNQNFILVSDIDETTENSVIVWYEILRGLCIRFLQTDPNDIPDYVHVALHGGSHWFKENISDFDPESYDLIHAYFQAINIINGHVTSMEEEHFLQTIYYGLYWYFAGFLTTRPATIRGEVSTRRKLHDHFGLIEDTAVVMRPYEVSMDDTETWKIEQLEKIVNEIGKPVVMVDDNIGLAIAIKERNLRERNSPNFIPIISVIYPGPRTDMEHVNEIIDDRSWIFSSDWSGMIGKLSIISGLLQPVS